MKTDAPWFCPEHPDAMVHSVDGTWECSECKSRPLTRRHGRFLQKNPHQGPAEDAPDEPTEDERAQVREP